MTASGTASRAVASAPHEADQQRSKATAFRAELTSPELSFLMEAHDGLSAKIVEEAGFKGIWASGLTMSAALGVRDSNEASWTQVLEVLEFMSDCTTIPIMVDGDTGYGNFNNMRRLVRKLCQRNIAAVCIEDKLFPKTNSFISEGQPLADIEEFCGKIKAGKDTQTDPDFSIVARIEAFVSGWGLDEALKRAEAYHAAGADGILVHSKLSTAQEVLAFMRDWDNRCPVVVVPTKYHSTPTETFREAGVSMSIWANHNLRAAIRAMRETSRRIFEEESIAGVEADIASVKDIFDLAGNRELAEAEARYAASAGRDRRAVIVAASRGSKLEHLTVDRPKCMIDVRGQPLLRRLVTACNEAGVRDIVVVRGYKKDAVALPAITTVDNDDYVETGEAASLACAAERLEGECIVSYGDILFRRFVLDTLLAVGATDQADVVLAVDALGRGKDYRTAERVVDLVSTVRPFAGDYLEEQEAVPITAAGHELAPETVSGEWIGLAWLSPHGAELVRVEIEAMHADGSLRTASLLDLIARLIDAGHSVAAAFVTGHWQDVDDAFDLAKARNLM
ncbi:MAG: phosphoenolpyruvate mutase [Alphaproteobacteria bacterium]|nr:phosphoenolpyruvate mutase [Alphaproteobacteria bacterium]